ncbi:hypothetical protein I317_01978 [Kwoniella heveanensis CBS 569]|nr:hypothetical protein I317_01978 [Kwoniella heveanensis CBS 569]
MIPTTAASVPRPRDITPTGPDLVNNPAPPPNRHPLGLAVVGKVLELAFQLVVSPSGLPIAAAVLSGSINPDLRYKAAICHVLHREQIAIVLVRNWPKEEHGLHVRPLLGYRYQFRVQNVISLNYWYTSLLLQGHRFALATGNDEDWNKHLFLSEITLAHEVIHFLRRPVHLMLRSHGLAVPYDTPSRADAVTGATEEAEGGWTFEKELLRGEVGACWVYDSDSPMESAGDEQAAANHDFELLYPKDLKVEEKGQPFDLLIIARENDVGETKRYEIKAEWLKGLREAFEQGRVSDITFPPEVDPESTNPLELLSSCGRHRGEMSFYILRSGRSHGGRSRCGDIQ